MEFLVVLLVLALAAVVIAFTVRVKVLKRSFREIAFGMEEKMREDSNTPLRAPSADKDVAKLVSYLNAQVDGAIAAKRQYEDADSELKRAVTNVSHDLRTPLTSAAGYLNLLQGSGLNEKQAAYARIVAGRIEAMKKLTEELFAYSVVAADEDGERRILSADVAAGNRGVKSRATRSRGGFGNAPRQRRAGRGHVAEDAPLCQTMQRAVFTDGDGFHIGGIAHDAEDDVGLLGNGAGRVGPARALVQQRGGLAFCPVVDSQRIAGLLQMRRHGMAHDARTDPADAKRSVHGSRLL